METPELYIPPCCIDKQLPGLIVSGGLHSMFYSQGDWGYDKLTHAVAHLVDSHVADVTTIVVIPDLTQAFVTSLRRELMTGSSSAFILVTHTDRTPLLRSMLSEAQLDRICYCPSRVEVAQCHLWMRDNGVQHLVVHGPIVPTHAFSAYTSAYLDETPASLPSTQGGMMAAPGSSDAVAPPPFMRQAFAPWRVMCRLHAAIRGHHPLLDLWLRS